MRAGSPSPISCPPEAGADRLTQGGYVDEEQLCRAIDVVTDAENDEELVDELDEAGLALGYDEEAFATGWDREAPAEVQGLGEALYNALFVACVTR